MRYLGIDMGEKHVGIALSDESGKMAFPKAVLPNDRNLFSEILRLVDDYEVKCIVFGESHDYSGKENPIMGNVHALISALERKLDIPIVLEPEFLTSEEAKRTQGENKMIDASAAAIILRSFIEKKNLSREK